MKKIGVIGEALIDKYNEKEQIGGAAFNVACSLAVQKDETYFLGSISNDDRGLRIEKEFEKYGVKDNFVERTQKPTTLSQVLLDEKNERTFTFIRNSDEDYDINKFDENKLNFDFVHFGSATGFLPGQLHESYKKLQEICVKKNIKYSVDPNYRIALWENLNINSFIEDVKHFLSNASVAKISDYELELITGFKDKQKGVEQIQKFVKDDALICITCGEQDTIVIYKKEVWTVPVYKVKPVDTTGAGDAFASRLIYLFNQQKELNKQTITSVVQDANNYAAQAVEYVGALTYLNVK